MTSLSVNHKQAKGIYSSLQRMREVLKSDENGLIDFSPGEWQNIIY
jgi:hypothetical protein